MPLVLVVLIAAACGSSSKHAEPGNPAGGTAGGTTSPATASGNDQTTPTLPPQPLETVTLPPPTTPKQSTTLKPSSPVVEQAVCPSEQSAGIVANFGERGTMAAAERLAARARHFGFVGLRVQRRGCDEFAVVLPSVKSIHQGRELQREARTVGLRVKLDCRSHPLQGGLAAVFGHRPTKEAAMRLKDRAQAVGFQNLQVQQDRCFDWEVDLHGLKTARERRELAAEARRAGFTIHYELG